MIIRPVFFLVLLCWAPMSVKGEAIIFDSFTPPDQGGFSSPDRGITTQVLFSAVTPISRFSILNRTREVTRMKFAIYSHPTHELLYASEEIVFESDGDDPTWKSSPELDFVFEAGQNYHLGYAHDVAVFDVMDFVPETMNGITSGFNVSIIGDYDSLEFERHFNGLADAGIRLHAVPEPVTLLPFVLAAFAQTLARQRRSKRAFLTQLNDCTNCRAWQRRRHPSRRTVQAARSSAA